MRPDLSLLCSLLSNDPVGLWALKPCVTRRVRHHPGSGSTGQEPCAPASWFEMQQVASTRWLAICPLALLLMSGCVTTPEEKLRQAATDGDLVQVTTLLAQGIAVQAADERGVTPLFIAAKSGNRDVAALLLDKGASPNQARLDGVTPLFVAVQEGHTNVVALFLENGADVNARAKMGAITLLHIGAYRGNQEVIALLLKHGADKNARISSGERPVDLARQRGHTTLIPLLEP